MTTWHYPAGATARDGWTTLIDSTIPGWRYTGLRVGALSPGGRLVLPPGPVERIVVPLAGAFQVHTDAATFELAGRPDVWSGPTDLAYLGPRTGAAITGEGRVAVTEAHARGASRAARRVPASSTAVEARGAGRASREVRNFATPDVLDAEAIIACEVVTPAGNWSSYPPHKHDHDVPGVESELEEIYHFELRTEPGAPMPAAAGPFGYQRVSASDARPIDVLAEVRDGDTVLVPYGWHGPSMAPPGYDMYYLNVMAGPGPERAWRITDHPDHTWVRGRWPKESLDPRLPFAATRTPLRDRH
jgi:5-deoxy-glucuronate isomerase